VAVQHPHASPLPSNGLCLNRVELLKMGNSVSFFAASESAACVDRNYNMKNIGKDVAVL
jgi:hypothetical protein